MFICFANAIVANTPYLADILKELGCGAEILKTIPVGVDTSFFIPKKVVQKVSGTLNIITVGRLSLEKGHIYALKVIKVLKNKGLDIHFRIVGEGQERLRLEQYIMESNLNNYVTLEGSKSQEEVRDLLWCSDLFLFTSIALGDGRSETQGLATIEAAACGLPAVVFDSGGVKYTVNDGVTGFMCKEKDVNAMVEKIELLYSSRSLISEMGDNSTIFVQCEYSQKTIDKEWKLIYGSLID